MKKEKKEDNFLQYIPNKKNIEWIKKEEKVFLIFQHDKVIEKFMRVLFKKPMITDIELDEISSETWISIDGYNTVYQISRHLESKFGKSCTPACERLILFLRYINKKGWIYFDRGLQIN